MMFELTINHTVYPFNFGIGFMRDIDSRISIPVENIPGKSKNVGLRYAVGCIVDGDIDMIIDVLDAANKGLEPRITRAEIESHIENENTDIDVLFKDVLDFFKRANCTKRITADILKQVEIQERQQAQMLN